MVAIPKKDLMARLHAKRKAAGLVRVSFWAPKAQVPELKRLAGNLIARAVEGKS